MAQECMSLFERKHLNMAANVEQCCATGYTSEGKTPKALVEEMVPLLDDKALTSVLNSLDLCHQEPVSKKRW
jgi:syntaxin-binding protein 1